MVSTNIRYLFTLPGLLKILTIVLGIISIGVGGHAFDNSLYNLGWKLLNIIGHQIHENVEAGIPTLSKETFFLGVVGVKLIFSILSLLCHILNDELTYKSTTKLVDIGMHIGGAVLQIIAGSLLIISANNINSMCPFLTHIGLDLSHLRCQYHGQKIFAGIIAILNGLAYAFVALVGVLRLSNNEPISTMN